jgi:hypothetical protein
MPSHASRLATRLIEVSDTGRRSPTGMRTRRSTLKLRRLIVVLSTLAMLMSLSVGTASATGSGGGVGVKFQQTLEKIGTSTISGGDVTFDASGQIEQRRRGPGEAFLHGGPGTPPVPPTQAPRPRGQRVVDATGTTHFEGLNHFDQRSAGTGAYANTQFSLEPPDQGLCVGKGFVLETVNTALRVRSASNGALLTAAMPLNQFFGLAPEIAPTRTPPFGDFTSDPKCYFDPANGGRWFLTLLQLDVDPPTGGFTGGSHTLIAVSAGSNPTGSWNLFRFATRNDGGEGTPTHPDCPCFGDQPLIGADKNGFYITTNEFSFVTDGFNGAIVYAISKKALASGNTSPVFGFWQPTLAEGQAYSLQPATTPPGGDYASENGGTEYFLSALEFTGGLDNRIALWSLSNSSSLNSSHPNLRMDLKILKSEVYGLPPVMAQPEGDAPLRDLLGAGEPVPHLNSNDDRMNQTVYVDGLIWGALNTVIEDRPAGGNPRVGIAWFAVQPQTWGHNLDGKIKAQGYVAVNGNNVSFPAVAANDDGDVLVAFSLVGPDYYPSAAYAKLDKWGGTGSVKVVSWGAGPADGFTGYPSFVGGAGVERWGDYSAAVADASGNLWFATEMINQTCTIDEFVVDTTCGGTRTINANWSTTIAKVHT